MSSAWELLATYPPADEADWVRHADGFVTEFVIPANRERWRELLTRRPRQIGRNSHKLHNHLDRRCCRPVPDLADLCGDGLFYGFADCPRVVPADAALVLAGGGDAILSLRPGRLAVYFFHEGELWVCRAAGI